MPVSFSNRLHFVGRWWDLHQLLRHPRSREDNLDGRAPERLIRTADNSCFCDDLIKSLFLVRPRLPLQPVILASFFQQVFDVNLNGAFGNREFAGNDFIGQSLSQQF